MVQPHNEHTDADNRNCQPTYDRTSPVYKPATWDSPEGYEKIDTGQFLTAWGAYEQWTHHSDDEKGEVPEGDEESSEEDGEGDEKCVDLKIHDRWPKRA